MLRSDDVCAGCAVWCLGFGSYLEGLTTIGYNLTGGDSTPGNVGIYDANSAKSIIGYGLCIIFIGALLLIPARFASAVLKSYFSSVAESSFPFAFIVGLHLSDQPRSLLSCDYATPIASRYQVAKGLKSMQSCVAGIFVNLSVRKPLVIDYKLPYPTGTATGVMINSFFTNGDLAKQQVKHLDIILRTL